MCRSSGTIGIIAAASGGLCAFAFLLLLFEDATTGEQYSCNLGSATNGSDVMDFCVPCAAAEGVMNINGTEVLLATNVLSYIVDHEINVLQKKWYEPQSTTDWNWFGYYICNFSWAGHFSGSFSDNATSQSESYVVNSDSSEPVACCCGSSSQTPVILETITCPTNHFTVTAASWIFFVGLVGGGFGVVGSIFSFIFLRCGCIEKTKGPFEILAEGMTRRIG